MLENNHKFRVRYIETDQMGHVHHANYVQYYEMGRIEWLRSFGVSYKEMEESGVLLPVAAMSYQFKKSAKYDDQLTLTTYLKELPTAKIIFEYKLHNDKNELLSTGETVLVFVNKETMRPIKCPDYLMDILKSHLK